MNLLFPQAYLLIYNKMFCDLLTDSVIIKHFSCLLAANNTFCSYPYLNVSPNFGVSKENELLVQSIKPKVKNKIIMLEKEVIEF